MPHQLTSRNLFFTGIVLTVLCAWFSVGYHHPDEHYQIWEFAKVKLGEAPVEDLPWEYAEKMRPGLQPFLAFTGIKFARAIGIDDPFDQVLLLRMLTGILVFLLYWKWSDVLAEKFADKGRFLKLCLLFFWLSPYLNVRFSSENLSALAFFTGLLLIYPDPNKKSISKLILSGFLICLAFFFRYQIAFAYAGLGLWLVFAQKTSWKNLALMASGALVALIPGALTDHWLYGEWVFAPYNYFAQNIIEDKAAGFGVSPWWWYFTEMIIFLLPPVSLFLYWFLGKGISRERMHVFVWCLVPFVIGHSLVGHKETRFLFPMLWPIFYLLAVGYDHIRVQSYWKSWLKGVFTFALVINFIALAYRTIYPANDVLPNIRFIRDYSAEHPGTTVFMDSHGGPKKETLQLHFYQMPWVHFEVTDSISQLDNHALYQPKPGDLIYFRTDDTSYCPEGFSKTLVYKWFPDWLLSININDWTSRTRIWKIYRLDKL
ncbi:MAG: hypothetical protein H6576_00915 [Lewinellaceae bacterium]|nr:hypothetical protein [Lewinellaceae bacterium]